MRKHKSTKLSINKCCWFSTPRWMFSTIRWILWFVLADNFPTHELALGIEQESIDDMFKHLEPEEIIPAYRSFGESFWGWIGCSKKSKLFKFWFSFGRVWGLQTKIIHSQRVTTLNPDSLEPNSNLLTLLKWMEKLKKRIRVEFTRLWPTLDKHHLQIKQWSLKR